MHSKLHIIYIPGLGDHRVAGQELALKIWKLYGVHTELFQMNWSDKEAWKPKLSRLLSRIDTLFDEGKQIGLVGASAGAPAVLIAYSKRKQKISSVVTIAGKIHNPTYIAPRLSAMNPAFYTAAHDCQQVLKELTAKDKSNMQSRYGFMDLIVPKKDSYLVGASNRRVFASIHFWVIAEQLTFGAGNIVRFMKKRLTNE